MPEIQRLNRSDDGDLTLLPHEPMAVKGSGSGWCGRRSGNEREDLPAGGNSSRHLLGICVRDRESFHGRAYAP